MNDLPTELSPIRKLLAYILANKVYDFGHDLRITLDYENQTSLSSFFGAYQIARLGYVPTDKRLLKFINEVLSTAKWAGDQTLISELNEAISSLES